MKQLIKIGTICLILALTSCAHEEQPVGDGYLDLAVLRNTEVEVVPVVKADDAEPVIAVKIVDEFDGSVAFAVADKNLITEPIKLRTSNYTAYATSGVDGGAAAFDSPFYCGKTEFRIVPQQITTASIECTLSSMMVTASFSQEIKDNFKYTLEVSNGLAALTFDQSNEQKTAYFSPSESLTWTLTLINAENEKFQIRDSYTDVEANQHYALSFSLKLNEGAADSFGAADFQIVLDDSLNEPTVHTPTIMIYESAPSVTGADAISRYMADAVTGSVYSLSSAREFTSISITHNSDLLESYGLPKSTDLTKDSLEDFVSASGVQVTLLNAQNEPVSSFDATVQDVKVDMSSFINSLPIGTYEINLYIENVTGMSANKKIYTSVVSSWGGLTLDPWAEFIYVKGSWRSNNQPENFKIQYKKTSDSNWIDFVPTVASQHTVNSSNNTFRAFICGVDPSSKYQVRVLSSAGADISNTVEGQTEGSSQIYNMSFDDWYESGGVWYPNAGSSNFVWDTANGGTKTVSVYPTEKESSDVVKGNAVKMTSKKVNAVVMTTFAAGNVYTGKFTEAILSISDPGAKLDWGVRYSGRPVAMSGYFKYSPVAIDNDRSKGGAYSSYIGTMDRCQIQVGLFNWNSVFKVDTQAGHMVDFSNANQTIIAHNKMESDQKISSYQKFVLPLLYRRTDIMPTYAIVTACSSYMGDYFVGGEGSQLLVDEFSFIFNPMSEDIPAADRDAFFALFN